MHLAGAYVEVQPVDGPHAAEAEHDATQPQRRGCLVPAQQLAQCAEMRQDRPVGRQRAPAAEIQQRRDPAGHGEHDHQQQDRVNEG